MSEVESGKEVEDVIVENVKEAGAKATDPAKKTTKPSSAPPKAGTGSRNVSKPKA